MVTRAEAIFGLLGALLMVVMAPTVGFTKDPVVSPLSVTGTWVIVSSAGADLTAVLTHSGTTIAGTVSDPENYPTGISGTSSVPAGSKGESRDVSLTVTFSDGLWVTFDGRVSADNTAITGIYHNSQGFSDPFTARRR